MFKLHYLSCEDRSRLFIAGLHIVARDSKGVFALGDTPYIVTNSTSWGLTTTTAAQAASVAEITEQYTQMFANPGWNKIVNSNTPLYMMSDDHEWGGDNWDHTVARACVQHPITGVDEAACLAAGLTQADIDAHHWLCTQAWIAAAATYSDNPINTDVDAIAEKPSNADAGTATSQYPVRYFRVGYDVNGNVVTSNPHVECFVIDCISHRDPLADTDDGTVSAPNKTMLGVNQRTWLKNQLSASSAVFKIIMSPKKTYLNPGADNTDHFGFYTKELSHILDHIDKNSIAGVAWAAGDRHTPSIISKKKPDDDYDNVCVTACPVGVHINPNAADTTYENGTVDFLADNPDYEHVYGEIAISESYMDIKLVYVTSGATKRSVRVHAGSNVISKKRISGVA